MMDGFGVDLDQLKEKFKDPIWGAQRLKEIALFKGFTEDELVMLYSIGELKKYSKSSHVVVEGEQSRGMYILLYGRVSVYKNDPSTNTFVRLTFLEIGANFGEFSLFDKSPRSATVAAETTCYLFHLEAEKYNQYLQESGYDLQVRFYKTCAEELSERFRHLNADYINSQQLLWRYALRRGDDIAEGKNQASQKKSKKQSA